MKFPVTMLHDFVETSMSADQLGDLLTMAGFELEGIETVEGDAVLDIKVVSNRGDGLSVFGLCREVLAKDAASKPKALYKRALENFDDGSTPDPNLYAVKITSTACDRFSCQRFTQVSNGDSPEWLQKRLRQAGMRPISLVVDLTNYVMLEMGQPLHAYDQDLLQGGIDVREAKTGEKLATLDGVERELVAGQTMICDDRGPIGAGGIMGGADTEVSSTTKNVLLEAGHFNNRSVRKTRKQLGLNTDASYRFERSVDPNGTVRGLNRFSELLLAESGGQRIPGFGDVYPSPTALAQVSLRHARTIKLLGMDVTKAEGEHYLTNLGFALKSTSEGWDVTVPSWRPDVVREEDLIEEVGRVHGFDKIPETLPRGATVRGGAQGELGRVDRIREQMLRQGVTQVLSHTLRDLHGLDRVTDRVGPRQPAGPDTAYLRNSLLPSLCEALQRNGNRNLHLFEIGKVFEKGSPFKETRYLAVLTTGVLYPPNRPSEKSPVADFYSLKAWVEASLGDLNLKAGAGDPRFHPTRSAQVLRGGIVCGVLGQIHPEVADAVGVPKDTFLAEVDLDQALKADSDPTVYKPVSRNPAVRRDITVGIAKSTPYRDMEIAIKKAAGDVLERVWLIDDYEGPGVDTGDHAVSFGLQLRKFGENFTDEEANQVRDSVVAALLGLGAKQR